MKKHLVIIGGGFAGFWSAMSAIRQSREIQKRKEVEITLINPDNYVTLRPRLNELSLVGQQFELDKYLKPLRIHQIVGRVELIIPEKQEAVVSTRQGLRTLYYDYLILSSGSSLALPDLHGLGHTFNINSFDNVRRLEDHMIELAKGSFLEKGATTFVVVGSEFSGLEAVVDIEQKARTIQAYYSEKKSDFRTILIESERRIASSFSKDCVRYIEYMLRSKSVEVISNNQITAIYPDSVVLQDGSQISTRTAIWTKGLAASSITQFFKSKKDETNRLNVDSFLKLPSYDNIIAAGGLAHTGDDHKESSILDCHYAQLEGRWAGHNAINDMFGMELKKYILPAYSTCVDLGDPETLQTNEVDRNLQKKRYNERAIEAYINKATIYPWRDVEETVKASSPEIPKF